MKARKGEEEVLEGVAQGEQSNSCTNLRIKPYAITSMHHTYALQSILEP